MQLTRPTRLRRDLRSSVIDGVAFSVMAGTGESYLAAFALAIGLGETFTGLLAALPLLAGAILQLVSPFAVRSMGSTRRWVVLCASVQASVFVPLAALALYGQATAAVIFALATIYWAAGLGTGAAWNTWMEHLVPARLRPGFFARRSRFAQLGLLSGLLAAGTLLDAATARGLRLEAFATLFVIAGVARMVSMTFLARQSEPPGFAHRQHPLEVGTHLGRFTTKGGGRLVAYVLAVHVAVQIAAPYFTPYMLGRLELPYGTYVMLLAASLCAKIAVLPALGRATRVYSPHAILRIAGIAIVPLPALWLVSSDPVYLAVLQVLGGLAWASFDLAVFLLYFDVIRSEERTSVLTLYNVVNAVAIVGGATLGGALLEWLGGDTFAYHVIFCVSAAGRALSLGLLWTVPSTIRGLAGIALRPVAVRPMSGSFDRPVVSSLPKDVPVIEPVARPQTSQQPSRESVSG